MTFVLKLQFKLVFAVCVHPPGYRPILYAMKKFSKSGRKQNQISDIEDLSRSAKWCSKENRPCKGLCSYKQPTSAMTGTLWFRPKTVSDVFAVFGQYSGKNIKLIVGDTGRGVCVYVCACVCVCACVHACVCPPPSCVCCVCTCTYVQYLLSLLVYF